MIPRRPDEVITEQPQRHTHHSHANAVNRADALEQDCNVSATYPTVLVFARWRPLTEW